MNSSNQILDEFYRLSGAENDHQFAQLSHQSPAAVCMWRRAKNPVEPTLRKLFEIAQELNLKLNISIQ